MGANRNGTVSRVQMVRAAVSPDEIHIFFNAIDKKRMHVFRTMLKEHQSLANSTWKHETALNEAISSGNPLMAIILLQHGADPNKTGEDGWKPLEWAATTHGMTMPFKGHGGRLHRSVLELLISRGAHVNAFGQHGYTALMAAASYNRLHAVRTLLKDGANPYAQTSNGKTAFDIIGKYRADVSSLPVARALLSNAPSLIFMRDRMGRTPLMYAVMYHDLNVVKLLISKGVDLNARGSESGSTPLMFAALSGQTKMARYLLKYGANASLRDFGFESPTDNGFTATYYATFYQHFRLAKILRMAAGGMVLAARGVPVSRSNAIPQTTPSANSTFSADGKSVSARVVRAFFKVIHKDRFMDYYDKKHMDALRSMLDRYPGLANASWKGRTALLEAMGDSRSGRHMAAILLHRGADPNQSCRGGWTPLEWVSTWRGVSCRCSPEGPKGWPGRPILELLISRGAHVNAFGQHGYTALMAAASYNRLRAVRTLLKDGANPYVQTSWGRTAFDMIGDIRAGGSLLPVAQALLSKAPSLMFLRNRIGRTPLMCAVINRHFGLVRFLISKGANVNARDGKGLTPLMFAASQGEGSVARYLLAHGADARFRDYHENSAAYYAGLFKHFRLAKMLRRAAQRHQGSDEH